MGNLAEDEPLPCFAGNRAGVNRGRPAHGDTVNAMDLPELLVADADEWRRWLSAHHADSRDVWLVLAKKGKADPTTLSYDGALDEAICFGWIDGQLGRRDTATFRRRFTPRKARSPWSQRNAAIAERLTASGRMHQSGEDEVREARERTVDGTPPTPGKQAWRFQGILRLL